MKLAPFFKTTALAAALSLAGNANAFILFDVNGDTAAGGEVQIDIFDWFPGNALFVDAVPITTAQNEFEVLIQASLNESTLGPGTEVTFQARVPLRAQIDSVGGSGTTYIVDTILDGGVFDIYYDDMGAGGLGTTGGVMSGGINNTDGLGFGDGRHILHGDILASVQPETGGITIGPASVGLLDQYGVDNQGGVTTVGVTGNLPLIRIETAAFAGLPLGFDLSFFPADINGTTIDVPDDGDPNTLDHDMELSTDNLAQFNNSNPHDVVIGVAPDYGTDGINDNSCGGTDPCDLHAESDGRSPFKASQVPEPTTTALLGLGLLGLGALRRRRSRT